MIIPGFNWQQWVVMRFKRSPALGRPTMSGVDSGFITAELVNLWIFLLISRIVRLCEYLGIAVRWSCSRTCEPLNSCSESNVYKEWPSVLTLVTLHCQTLGTPRNTIRVDSGFIRAELVNQWINFGNNCVHVRFWRNAKSRLITAELVSLWLSSSII